MSRFEYGPPPPPSERRRVTVHAHATPTEIFRVFARDLTLPAWFGSNLDALWDALSRMVEGPIEVVHRGLPDADDVWLDQYLELLADAAEEVGVRVCFPKKVRGSVEAFLLHS